MRKVDLEVSTDFFIERERDHDLSIHRTLVK